MERKIVAFRQDDAGDWIAVMECGHTRHMRHRPPWEERLWVLTESGRRSRLGAVLDCRACRKTLVGPT